MRCRRCARYVLEVRGLGRDAEEVVEDSVLGGHGGDGDGVERGVERKKER